MEDSRVVGDKEGSPPHERSVFRGCADDANDLARVVRPIKGRRQLGHMLSGTEGHVPSATTLRPRGASRIWWGVMTRGTSFNRHVLMRE